MKNDTTIFALFAVLVAVVWGAWDLVADWFSRCSTREKAAIIAVCAVLVLAAMWRGVVPVVWEYGNLLLELI